MQPERAREIATILDGLERESDGIYSSVLPAATEQGAEVLLREAVAQREYADLMFEIGHHHSLNVMDRELCSFLRLVPACGVVVDVGGGWGWHWRGLAGSRPDISVVVVDFVRANLRLAARMLGALVNEQVFLVHGDATKLPFPPAVFAGYWSVQALQHIPGFEAAVMEAHRVLRPNGEFACYSLNRARVIEAAYRVMGKPYHGEGTRAGSFFLARASNEQAAIVSGVFGARVWSRYTEVLFHPDLRLQTGGAASLLGRIDSRLSSRMPFFSWIARQRSYHTCKPL